VSSRRRVEEELDRCLREGLKGLAEKNSISALVRTFVECYRYYDEARARVKYVSEFSRVATLALHEGFRCEEARRLLDSAANYLDGLYKELEKGVGSLYSAVFAIDMRLVSRLLVYTRNPFLPLEVSLAWDPVLNLPYIPSSSIKGAVRSWIELYVGKSVEGVSLEEVFGSEPGSVGGGRSSLVIFTDAYPVSCTAYLIEPDVITPHYSVAELAFTEPEALPTPIVFPTIAPNTVLRFIVAFKRKGDNGRSLGTNVVTKLVELIMKALEDGLGAKTSIGYGRAKPVVQSMKTSEKVTTK
jgi:CRISPR-associated protein Cmr6